MCLGFFLVAPNLRFTVMKKHIDFKQAKQLFELGINKDSERVFVVHSRTKESKLLLKRHIDLARYSAVYPAYDLPEILSILPYQIVIPNAHYTNTYSLRVSVFPSVMQFYYINKMLDVLLYSGDGDTLYNACDLSIKVARNFKNQIKL